MSSNSSIRSGILQLQYVSQNIAIVLGIVLLISGILGNILNIITFYMLGNWKHNPSSLYILFKSFVDLFCLIPSLLTAILTNGFQIDFTTEYRMWCKFRIFIILVGSLISLTCICLQAIDVFFCSTHSANLRRKSNIRLARYLIIGTVFVWIAHTIPALYFQDLVPKDQTFICTGLNSIYNQYTTYFVTLGFNVLIPITIISIFCYLTYQNLCIVTISNHRLLSSISRQMINMAFFQIIILLLFQLPLGIVFTYILATSNFYKDNYRLAQEQTIRTFVVIFSYGTLSVNTRIIDFIK